MMLILADFLDVCVRDALLKFDSFLKQAGWEGRYCVAPDLASCGGSEVARAIYEEASFEGWPFAAHLTLNAARTPVTLTTGVRDAIRIIASLADDPGWLSRLSTIDPRAEDDVIINQFGIDVAAVCRANVAAHDPGAHIAPHQGGYAYYLVETNGAVSVLSWSKDVAAVALHLVAQREGQRNRLSERVAKARLE